MRTPDSLHLLGLNEAIARLRGDEARAVRSAASGRRLERPSDDPTGASQAATLRSELGTIAATAAAAAHARLALDAADSSLGAMDSILGEVLVRGAQGATSLADPEARRALAADIRAAAGTLLNEGNRKVEGYSLFAGARTTTTAYALAADGSFVYQGDGVVRTLDVDGEAVALNAPGAAILAGPVNAGTALETLARAVETGDVTGAAAAITGVEQVRRQASASRTGLGLATARLERGAAALDRKAEGLTAGLSGIEDADLVGVATDLQRIQLFLGAALGAAGKSQHPTLFEFLA